MKFRFLITLRYGMLIFLSIVVVQCANEDENIIPAIADFTADNAGANGITIQCGECVTFEDRSTGDVGALFWDFEGGDPSTSEEDFRVTVCYANPGKYDVSLSINAGEDRIARTDYVCVLNKLPELVAEFKAEDTNLLRGLDVQFTDQSTGSPTSWSWAIQDSARFIESFEQNPLVTLSNPGNYDVTLTVTRGSDSDVEEKLNYLTILDYDDFSCQVLTSTGSDGTSDRHTFNSEGQLELQESFMNGEPTFTTNYKFDNESRIQEAIRITNERKQVNRIEYDYLPDINAIRRIRSQKIFNERDVLILNYEYYYENSRLAGGTLDQPDGQGGIARSDFRFGYFFIPDSSDLAFVTEEYTFNGAPLGQIEYHFGTLLSAFYDMQVEQYPFRSFNQNIERIVQKDATGNILFESNSTFGANEFNRVGFEVRTIGANTIRYDYTYNCEQK